MTTAVLQILFSISRMAFGGWFPAFLPAGSTGCRESTVEGSLGKNKSTWFSFFFKYLWDLSKDTFSSYSGGLWSKIMLKAGQARSGRWGPHLTEPWLSPRMEMLPPLWTLTQCLTVIMVKTSSLVGFPKLHCPLPHVLWLSPSRNSLAPSSLCPLMTKLQTGVRLCHSSSQYWTSLVFLACLSLVIVDVFVRDAGDLELFWPFSCFLAF